MSSHSFATLTKALGLGKSRKQTRPSTIHTSISHSSLFSPSADDLSGSPRSAPPARSSRALRHSKSTTNIGAGVGAFARAWSRNQRVHTADHVLPAPAPTPPALAPNPKARFTFALGRRSTSSASTASSDRTSSLSSSSTHFTTAHTANESIPHSPLPAQIWPRLTWDPSLDADDEDIDLGPDADDDHDSGPVFADFFQRLRDIEAELDLIEAR